MVDPASCACHRKNGGFPAFTTGSTLPRSLTDTIPFTAARHTQPTYACSLWRAEAMASGGLPTLCYRRRLCGTAALDFRSSFRHPLVKEGWE